MHKLEPVPAGDKEHRLQPGGQASHRDIGAVRGVLWAEPELGSELGRVHCADDALAGAALECGGTGREGESGGEWRGGPEALPEVP